MKQMVKNHSGSTLIALVSSMEADIVSIRNLSKAPRRKLVINKFIYMDLRGELVHIYEQEFLEEQDMDNV